MSKITVLPEELSNRIAAGEVVERPASVLKELLENAVDAGARHISVSIEKAGAHLIAVSDDGGGMAPDDALLAFAQHATSKIKTAQDIDRIVTLGFRGEALPSIAAVSQLTLKTRTEAALEGTEIVIHGGKLVRQLPAGCPVGTEIAVRNLFFNVPARKKFLRSAATEEAHLTETATMLALGFMQVGLTLRSDGRTIFNSPGAAELRPRLTTLFGKAFVEKLLPLAWREEGIVISGFIAMPGFSRNSRREQRTFVNGRAVESPSIFRGIRDGYGTLADYGRYAPVVLYCQLAPEEFDINVHPTKREIRFRSEYAVSRAVANAVRAALRNTPTPEITFPETLVNLDSVLVDATVRYAPARAESVLPLTMPDDGDDASVVLDSAAVASAPEPEPPWTPEPENRAVADGVTEPVTEPVRASVAEPPRFFRDSGDWNFLGVALGTYIVAEFAGENALTLIDFHAAHERVLYEKLCAGARSAVPSQQLLLPLNLELGRVAAAWLGKHGELFEKMGFELAPLSSNTIMLSAIPAALPAGTDWERLLADTAAELLTQERTQASVEAIARAACHAAVRANDLLAPEAARGLLAQLRGCERPDVCPHGRPTMLKLTRAELERRFGRA